MDIYREYEQFLDAILNASKYAKQHPNKGNNSGSGRSQQQQRTNAHRQHTSNTARSSQGDDNKYNGDDDDDDGNDNGNNGNNNSPIITYPYYACQGCMLRDQMILGQAGLIVKSSETINVLMNKIKRLSTSPDTSNSIPPQLLATPVRAPLPTLVAAQNHAPQSMKKAAKKKKKTLKAKTKRAAASAGSYDPPSAFRARGQIKIARNFTENVVPQRIRER
eukprot:CAMPEP_0197036994 /NCGR_PEP_ID=MMETSP1384-20130603/14318_1 /TAXON_ID=29189 /ORGANISM="Ammonia sp." /LENGTH=219 /DNA_ID=CAMNT_0042467233 /DNA_START=1 /DNA_END=657 /DNA_ORIENTATION=-